MIQGENQTQTSQKKPAARKTFCELRELWARCPLLTFLGRFEKKFVQKAHFYRKMLRGTFFLKGTGSFFPKEQWSLITITHFKWVCQTVTLTNRNCNDNAIGKVASNRWAVGLFYHFIWNWLLTTILKKGEGEQIIFWKKGVHETSVIFCNYAWLPKKSASFLIHMYKL